MTHSQIIYCILPGAVSYNYPASLKQIERVCRLHGAYETFVGRLNNWNNQPEVICFTADETSQHHIGRDSLLVDGYNICPVWPNAELEKFQYGGNDENI